MPAVGWDGHMGASSAAAALDDLLSNRRERSFVPKCFDNDHVDDDDDEYGRVFIATNAAMMMPFVSIKTTPVSN